MLPSNDAATTVYSPCCSAAMLRIISTTLPNVALSRPPTVSPNRTARSSVTSPSSSAKGMSARKFCRAAQARRVVCVVFQSLTLWDGAVGRPSAALQSEGVYKALKGPFSM